jgi:hypothetical protein
MDGSQAVPQGAQGAAQGAGAMGGPPGGFAGGRPGGGAMMFLGPYGGIVAFALLVITYIVLAIALWKFLSKAGLTPAVALLMLVPVVNLGVALWAAFAEWPALSEVARLKERVAVYELRADAPAHPSGEALTPSAPA